MMKRSRSRADDAHVRILSHPLIDTDMVTLRDKRTGQIDFRDALRRVSRLIAVETLAELPSVPTRVRTPLSPHEGRAVKVPVVFIPVLRAGLGMLDGFLDVFPNATVGHIGLYRDEATLDPVEYLVRLPRGLRQAITIVIDPMLATGGSGSAALTLLKAKGARRLRLATLLSAPEGIARLFRDHPDVPILTCAVDKKLNAKGFIVPGLGDAGDRLFGTV